MRTSDELDLGFVYSRNELRERFGIVDETINNGVFRPAGHDSIWLFVTERKTPDRTQYQDLLVGDDLTWDGQAKGRTDKLIIHHAADGNELLLFYREKKNEFENYGFRYEGPFRYVYRSGSGPTHFKLRRDRPDETPAEIVSGAVEAAQARAHGQGIAVSQEARKTIELYAMAKATDYFRTKGYMVVDRSSTKPYDLECDRPGERIYVEVKGTQGNGSEVLLTPNEVALARQHKARMALYVCHSVEVRESEAGTKVIGGTVKILRPWDVDRGVLAPLGYPYQLPNGS